MHSVARRQVAGVVTLALVAIVAAVTLSPAGVARVMANLADRPLLFAGLLSGAYLLRFLAAWPISALSVVVGFTLGARAVPLALAGAVVTCLPPYLLADRFDRRGPLGTLADHGDRYFTATGGLRGVIAARLAPLPADAVSYTAGLSGVALPVYALGTALGELPWVTAAVLVGASAEQVTTDGVAGGLPLIVGAVALAVLLLAGPAYRTLRG
ncbi:MAG: VTT domain-containing protein [Halobacteriales archaeon]|nr:VTT domain-containing protein [Halobacteriales archaeon]